MLDARRLEIYCAVVEEGSFTDAAARLHLSQSAISQQIAILERDLGLALLERLSRGVTPTVAGQLLARRARFLLRQISGVEQELHRLAEPLKRVTLGVFGTAGSHLVPILVSKYRKRYPDMQLFIHACRPEDIEAKLNAGEIDVGITWDYDFLMRPIGELYRQPLLTDPMCLLLARNHPLANDSGPVRLAELADELWVMRTHSSPRYEEAFELMCRIVGFEPRIAFRTDDYQSVQGLVAANVGTAVVPHLSILAQRPDIVVRAIHDPSLKRLVDAITLPGYGRNPATQQLLACLIHES